MVSKMHGTDTQQCRSGSTSLRLVPKVVLVIIQIPLATHVLLCVYGVQNYDNYRDDPFQRLVASRGTTLGPPCFGRPRCAKREASKTMPSWRTPLERARTWAHTSMGSQHCELVSFGECEQRERKAYGMVSQDWICLGMLKVGQHVFFAGGSPRALGLRDVLMQISQFLVS